MRFRPSATPASPARSSLPVRLGAALTALAVVAAQAAPASAADPAAAAVPPGAAEARAAIEGLHETLLGTMKSADELGYEGRRERIDPALRRVYDFPFMAEKSIGSRWKELGEAERARLVDAFARLAIATYAARFDGYGGERFETLGEEAASHETLLVRTRIVRPDEDPVPLDYRMRRTADGWRIVDVFLNGTVSELALRRAEYSAKLKRDGFDALIASVEEKIAAQAKGGGDDEAVF